MSQVKVERKKVNGVDSFVITAPISPRASKSGKSIVLASTNGNMPTTEAQDDQPVILGLNMYVKK